MTDSEFGPITLRQNARARGYVFRVREGHLLVTVPPYHTERQLLESIEQLRPKLRKMFERAKAKMGEECLQRLIDWSYCIETEDLTFSLQPSDKVPLGRCTISKDNGHVTFYLHPDTDFSQTEIQQWLQRAIIEQVRSYARGLLPGRLRELSKQFNLPFKTVAINAAKGRWGSCGSKIHRKLGFVTGQEYHINLSLFTLLLPHHLQCLVMLHELTHTLEMNHSPRFHARLDAMLDGREAALNKELRTYTTDLSCFARRTD